MKVEQIQNLSESKVSIKIESNSRGFTTSVHIYEGASRKAIDKTIEDTLYAHQKLQKSLTPATVIPELA